MLRPRTATSKAGRARAVGHLVSPQVAAATAVAGHLAEPNDLPAPSELVEV